MWLRLMIWLEHVGNRLYGVMGLQSCKNVPTVPMSVSFYSFGAEGALFSSIKLGKKENSTFSCLWDMLWGMDSYVIFSKKFNLNYYCSGRNLKQEKG